MTDNTYKILHFKKARVIYPENENILAKQTYENFAQGINKTLEFFDLDINLPLFNIFIIPSRKEYDSFVSHLTATPTDKSRVGQPQLEDLYLLSPNAYPTDADKFYLNKNGSYDKDIYNRIVVHEAVHMIEEFISPKDSMEVRPSWWSEGLAVLVSEQYKLDSDIVKRLEKDLISGQIPKIKDLDGANAYIWGWSVIRFIIENLGTDKITYIMKETCDADIFKYLQTTEIEFEKKWRKFALNTTRKIIESSGSSN